MEECKLWMSQNQYDMISAFPNKWDSTAQHTSRSVSDHSIKVRYNTAYDFQKTKIK